MFHYWCILENHLYSVNANVRILELIKTGHVVNENNICHTTFLLECILYSDKQPITMKSSHFSEGTYIYCRNMNDITKISDIFHGKFCITGLV